MICGHGNRDKRCGILGPILKNEFKRQLKRRGLRFTAPSGTQEPDDVFVSEDDEEPEGPTWRVCLTSHIGGHKWAGNVGIYIPKFRHPQYESGKLGGMGIWYGRVRPEDVEGIIEATLVGGKIIKELFRGAIDSNGQPIWL